MGVQKAKIYSPNIFLYASLCWTNQLKGNQANLLI